MSAKDKEIHPFIQEILAIKQKTGCSIVQATVQAMKNVNAKEPKGKKREKN